MMFFIYIFLCFFGINKAINIQDDNIDLMAGISENPVYDSENIPAYNYSTTEKNIFTFRTNNLSGGKSLPSEYILSARFKVNDMSKYWCLFQIIVGNKIVISVCFEVARAGKITRITLYMRNDETENSVYFLFTDDFVNTWSDIGFYITETDVTFKIGNECIETRNINGIWPSVTLTEDMDLLLAVSSASIQVYIQNIKLYWGLDITIKSFCNEDRDIFDITKSTDDCDNQDCNELGVDSSLSESITSEVCQCSEETFKTFLMKYPQLKGPAGEKGPPGIDGTAGTPGLTGNIGPKGDTGPTGTKGEKGEKGMEGLKGPMGPAGVIGPPGMDGRPGNPGLKGSKGEIGPPGPRYMLTEEEKKASIVKIPGIKGDKGPMGPPGLNGQIGKTGPKGDKGDRCVNGTKGDQGPEGPQGFLGEKGQKGEAGVNGIPGTPGGDGKIGNRGEKGDKGSPGLSGIPATLSSLLYEEIRPEEKELIVRKLQGFQGDKGETGEKGDKGDRGFNGGQGPPGNDGKDGASGKVGDKGEKGEIGPIGPRGERGDRGEPGPAGKVPVSEIALLKGAKGDRGLPGLSGPTGLTGSKGEKGEVGPMGTKGEIGEPGAMGDRGPIGPPGFNGAAGEKGQKGESAPEIHYSMLKGDKGDIGMIGLPGHTGKPGPKGPPGWRGRKGDRGLPGQEGPKGNVGSKGETGQPGLSIIGEKGEKGDCADKNFAKFADLNDEEAFYPANTFVYVSMKGVIKATHSIPIGTLVYVLKEKILLIKASNQRWNRITLRPLDYLPPAPRIPPEPTSYRPPTNPSFTTSTSTTTSRPFYTTKSSNRRRKYIRLIALNEPYAGTGKTRKLKEDADSECYEQSGQCDFMAFRANMNQYLKSLIPREDWDLPVVNLHEDILFETWESMFNGSGAVIDIQNRANIFSFNGNNIFFAEKWKNRIIWHGATIYGGRNHNCNDWTSSSHQEYGMGSSLASNKLLGQEFVTCDKELIVLCVETRLKIENEV